MLTDVADRIYRKPGNTHCPAILRLAELAMAAIAPLLSCNGSYLAHEDLQVLLTSETYRVARLLMCKGVQWCALPV